MTADDVRERLTKVTNSAGGKSAWGRQHGISPAYISDVIGGRRDPGEKILQALGLERVVTYRRAT